MLLLLSSLLSLLLWKSWPDVASCGSMVCTVDWASESGTHSKRTQLAAQRAYRVLAVVRIILGNLPGVHTYLLIYCRDTCILPPHSPGPRRGPQQGGVYARESLSKTVDQHFVSDCSVFCSELLVLYMSPLFLFFESSLCLSSVRAEDRIAC